MLNKPPPVYWLSQGEHPASGVGIGCFLADQGAHDDEAQRDPAPLRYQDPHQPQLPAGSCPTRRTHRPGADPVAAPGCRVRQAGGLPKQLQCCWRKHGDLAGRCTRTCTAVDRGEGLSPRANCRRDSQVAQVPCRQYQLAELLPREEGPFRLPCGAVIHNHSTENAPQLSDCRLRV